MEGVVNGVVVYVTHRVVVYMGISESWFISVAEKGSVLLGWIKQALLYISGNHVYGLYN